MDSYETNYKTDTMELYHIFLRLCLKMTVILHINEYYWGEHN